MQIFAGLSIIGEFKKVSFSSHSVTKSNYIRRNENKMNFSLEDFLFMSRDGWLFLGNPSVTLNVLRT